MSASPPGCDAAHLFHIIGASSAGTFVEAPSVAERGVSKCPVITAGLLVPYSSTIFASSILKF